jgi:predicted transcriptional regulator
VKIVVVTSGARTNQTQGSSRPADDNVTYMRLIDDVRQVMTLEEVAAAVGASERTVQNWTTGATRPRGKSADRALDLTHLVKELREVLTDEGIEIWLKSRNRNLGGRRPHELLSDGAVDEVLEEVERVVRGMG